MASDPMQLADLLRLERAQRVEEWATVDVDLLKSKLVERVAGHALLAAIVNQMTIMPDHENPGVFRLIVKAGGFAHDQLLSISICASIERALRGLLGSLATDAVFTMEAVTDRRELGLELERMAKGGGLMQASSLIARENAERGTLLLGMTSTDAFWLVEVIEKAIGAKWVHDGDGRPWLDTGIKVNGEALADLEREGLDEDEEPPVSPVVEESPIPGKGWEAYTEADLTEYYEDNSLGCDAREAAVHDAVRVYGELTTAQVSLIARTTIDEAWDALQVLAENERVERYNDGADEREVVLDTLMLVLDEGEVDEARFMEARFTWAELLEIRRWAFLTHLRASDNDNAVPAPPAKLLEFMVETSRAHTQGAFEGESVECEWPDTRLGVTWGEPESPWPEDWERLWRREIKAAKRMGLPDMAKALELDPPHGVELEVSHGE